jgi:hypothetical protein
MPTNSPKPKRAPKRASKTKPKRAPKTVESAEKQAEGLVHIGLVAIQLADTQTLELIRGAKSIDEQLRMAKDFSAKVSKEIKEALDDIRSNTSTDYNEETGKYISQKGSLKAATNKTMADFKLLISLESKWQGLVHSYEQEAQKARRRAAVEEQKKELGVRRDKIVDPEREMRGILSAQRDSDLKGFASELLNEAAAIEKAAGRAKQVTQLEERLLGEHNELAETALRDAQDAIKEISDEVGRLAAKDANTASLSSTSANLTAQAVHSTSAAAVNIQQEKSAGAEIDQQIQLCEDSVQARLAEIIADEKNLESLQDSSPNEKAKLSATQEFYKKVVLATNAAKEDMFKYTSLTLDARNNKLMLGERPPTEITIKGYIALKRIFDKWGITLAALKKAEGVDKSSTVTLSPATDAGRKVGARDNVLETPAGLLRSNTSATTHGQPGQSAGRNAIEKNPQLAEDIAKAQLAKIIAEEKEVSFSIEKLAAPTAKLEAAKKFEVRIVEVISVIREGISQNTTSIWDSGTSGVHIPGTNPATKDTLAALDDLQAMCVKWRAIILSEKKIADAEMTAASAAGKKDNAEGAQAAVSRPTTSATPTHQQQQAGSLDSVIVHDELEEADSRASVAASATTTGKGVIYTTENKEKLLKVMDASIGGVSWFGNFMPGSRDSKSTKLKELKETFETHSTSENLLKFIFEAARPRGFISKKGLSIFYRKAGEVKFGETQSAKAFYKALTDKDALKIVSEALNRCIVPEICGVDSSLVTRSRRDSNPESLAAADEKVGHTLSADLDNPVKTWLPSGVANNHADFVDLVTKAYAALSRDLDVIEQNEVDDLEKKDSANRR